MRTQEVVLETPVVEVLVVETPVLETLVEEALVMDIPVLEAPVVEVVSRGRCEVAVQWECPEGQCQEVGVQSQALYSDAAVQVDLIGLSGARPGSCDVPWRCVSVRPEEPGGGALWLCCLHSPSAASLCPALTRTPTRTEDRTPTKTPDQELDGLNRSGLSLPSMPICGDSPSSPHHNTIQAPDHVHEPVDALDDPNASQPTPETLDVTSETLDVTSETLNVTSETLDVTSETLDVTSETLDVTSETLDVTSETLDVTSETLNVTSETLNVTSETLDVTSEAQDPTSEAQDPTSEAQDPTYEAQDLTSEAQDPEEMEALGFMAPLSSDEDGAALSEHYEQLTADPPIKRRRGRSKNCESRAPLAARRRNPNARQVGLPLRYQLDYDLESPERTAANQEPGNGEGAGPGRRRGNKKVLFLPYYNQPLDLGEITDIQKPLKNELEDNDLQIRSVSPNAAQNTPHFIPPKKVRKKTHDWSIDNPPMKEGMDEASLDLTNRNWSKCQKIAIKQQGQEAANCQKQRQIFIDPNAVKKEVNRQHVPVKRKPGRPRKAAKLKQEQFEITYITGQDLVVEEDDERPGSEEQSDRPRRKTVGPPVRYLLESESPNAMKRARGLDLGDDFEEPAIEAVEYVGQYRLTLGDVCSSGEGNGGTVKKVKILNRDSEGLSGSPDIHDLFVLRGVEDDDGNETTARHPEQGQDPLKTRRPQRPANEGWRQRGRRDQDIRGGARTESKNSAVFLIHRDEETGRTTFISPCFVNLQRLKE